MKIINNIAILENDTHISKWVIESGRLDHDQNMLPFILANIKAGDVVIDAGAYIGDHTIAYAERVGKDGFVFAFEPNKEAFDCLEYNLKTFDNTTIFNQGLGSKIEKMGMLKSPDNIGMCHLIKGGDITVTTIDDLYLFKCDFIKIDCEGYELEILKGGYETIRRFKPTLLIELNKYTLEREGITFKHIFNFLDNIGYIYNNIYEEQDLNQPQIDIICRPK